MYARSRRKTEGTAVVAQDKLPQTLMDAVRHFTPDVADAYVASIKWPVDVCCARCGSLNVVRLRTRRVWQCREKGCRKQSTLLTGTILEGSHLRTDQWVLAIWQISNCKNGISSYELARAIGCKQQSAWHLLHRVRHLYQQNFAGQFGTQRGAVEADSTFVGGRLKWMSYERAEAAKARGNQGKTQVHAIKDRRSSTVRATVTPEGVKHYAKSFLWENVHPSARVYTDEGREYDFCEYAFSSHKTVNHSALEYGRGPAHVNGLECYFNCLRRALKGTYIQVDPEHLQAYVDEATYRFNLRRLTDWERFEYAMKQIVGKRLTYLELTGGAKR